MNFNEITKDYINNISEDEFLDLKDALFETTLKIVDNSGDLQKYVWDSIYLHHKVVLKFEDELDYMWFIISYIWRDEPPHFVKVYMTDIHSLLRDEWNIYSLFDRNI